MDFVSWDYEIPNWMEQNMFQNHQPVIHFSYPHEVPHEISPVYSPLDPYRYSKPPTSLYKVDYTSI